MSDADDDDDLNDDDVISRVAPGLFTDIDREWRKRWLKAQELTPREKAYHFFYLWDNPEFRKARLNPLRRIWQGFSVATLHNINSLVNVDHKSKGVVAKHTFSIQLIDESSPFLWKLSIYLFYLFNCIQCHRNYQVLFIYVAISFHADILNVILISCNL